jgi:predicted anti-sigma-YlaC factor YlaD
MDCPLIEPELVAFHLGVLAREPRSLVEEHLVACPACVRAYLAIKRAGESGGVERPSEEARLRLRAAVARAVARPSRRLAYSAIAAVAVVALALLAGALGVHRGGRPSDLAATPPSVDSARFTPVSLNVL